MLLIVLEDLIVTDPDKIREAVEVEEAVEEKKKKEKEKKKLKVRRDLSKPQGQMEFHGKGIHLFLYFCLIPLISLFFYLPLPFLEVSVRNWLYKNLDITVEGKNIDISFAGNGGALLKYWIPTLLLIAIAIVLPFFNIVATTKGFFILILLTALVILTLLPISFLYVAKRKYILENIKVNLGGGEATENIAKIVFDGKGLALLGYLVLTLLSSFLFFIPIPWIIVAVLKWFARSTTIFVGQKEYRPTFAGSGTSLFWYMVGLVISFFLLLFPFAYKSTVVWFTRYFNIIGLDRTVEFEFKGGAGAIYLLFLIEGFFILVGSLLGNVIYNLSKIPTALWAILIIKTVGILFLLTIILIPLPFVLASFLKWQIDNTDIYLK
jgi:hypothetical protein